MSKYDDCDFRGWATRNDVLCSDGRTIRQDAFREDDGKKVPLIWGHQHDSPEAVLGHGFLESRPEGVYFYGYLNDTPMAKYSKEAIKHGDITSLSIWANQLIQKGGDVLHGSIKEVSLVLAGANRKACIEYPVLAHGDDTEEDMTEAYIWMGDEFTLAHSDKDDDEMSLDDIRDELKVTEDKTPEEKSDDQNASEKKEKTEMDEKKTESGKTIGEILDGLNDEQKMAVATVIGYVKQEKTNGKDADSDEKEEKEDAVEHSEGGNTMQYNAFETPEMNNAAYLSHADEEQIIANAKKLGTLKGAIDAYAEENSLSHDGLAPVSGFTSYPSGQTPAGVDALFPEWHDVRPGAPELVTNDQAWVKAVLNKVHRSPFSRIRTSQVDLREIEGIRAKGYQKGKEKTLADNYTVAKRTTEPQTIYAKSALNRDDVVDITDFDYVDYQYKIDRMQLEKELARAILIGDGRDAASDDKINEERIRPIWTDNQIFTIRKVVSATAAENDPGFGANYVYAQAVEETILDAMIDYRGSGNMDMFCTQRFFNKIQLAKDLNGRRLYKDKGEVISTLGVNAVYNVPEFENLTRTEGSGATAKTYRLLAIIGNLNDYNIGATKGGEITHFTDFDIDFNQLKSLIETRVSGANTRIYSFIVLEEEVA